MSVRLPLISQVYTRILGYEVLKLSILGQVSGLLHSLVQQDLFVPQVNHLAIVHVFLCLRDLLRERKLAVSFCRIIIIVFVTTEGGDALILVFRLATSSSAAVFAFCFVN